LIGWPEGALRVVDSVMEFVDNGLPPYVFATINDLKTDIAASRERRHDLGFGNPDLPSPAVAVENWPRRHTTTEPSLLGQSGIPKLRSAVADLYQRKFDVALDPDTEVVTTIGPKKASRTSCGSWSPRDTALVPSPSYPIHIWVRSSPARTCGRCRSPARRSTPTGSARPTGEAFFDGLMHAWRSPAKPRVIVLSFPHTRTTACVDLSFMEGCGLCREHEVVLVHDFA